MPLVLPLGNFPRVTFAFLTLRCVLPIPNGFKQVMPAVVRNAEYCHCRNFRNSLRADSRAARKVRLRKLSRTIYEGDRV